MRRYRAIKELGDGTYGSVSLARKVDNGTLVAIKKSVTYAYISFYIHGSICIFQNEKGV